MAYKILLTGLNLRIMRGFFEDGNSDFDPVGCQSIEEDIEKHINHFAPEALVYCMSDEATDIMKNVSEAIKRQPQVKLVLVGSGNEIGMFESACDAKIAFKADNASTSAQAQKAVSDFLSGKETVSVSEEETPSGGSSSWDDILAQIDDEIEDGGKPAPAESNASAESAAPAESNASAESAAPAESNASAESVAPVEEKAPTPAPAPAPAQTQAPTQAADSNKRHILIIDDDPLMLKIIKDYLHDDYEIATAKGGKLAYKFLEKKRTDLILLDYEMPEEKGPEVFVNIRKMPGMQSVPIVFMTGVKDKERVMEVVKLKPQGYIPKPVSYDSLMSMVNKVFK